MTAARLQLVDPKTAGPAAKPLLDAVQAQLGVTPNFVRALAHSPKALEGFLGLYGALAGFSLDKAAQERVALAIAEANACAYCVSAHTAIGRHAGLSNEEMLLNRSGSATEAQHAALVAFAKTLNDNRGDLTDAEFTAARRAGLGDAQIIEAIALVTLNFFTNLIGKSLQIDIDFPKVALLPSRAEAVAA